MGQFWVKTIALSGSVLGDRQHVTALFEETMRDMNNRIKALSLHIKFLGVHVDAGLSLNCSMS